MPRTQRPLPQKHRNKWRIRWEDEHNVRRSEAYDTYDDALFKLDEHLLNVRQVKRGLRGLSVPDRTMDQLCDLWLRSRARLKRSEQDDQSIIRKHLRPFFGRHLLRNLSLDLVDEFIEAREHLNQKTINNHLTLLIAMLNEARERGWVRELPKIKKFKIQLFDKEYRWLRTKEEIGTFLASAKQEEDETVFVLYATAIYTGMRAGELAGLAWSKVDFERRLIAVDCSYDGKTKDGDVRYVPLLDPLVPVLRAWRLRTPGRLVFPNSTGRMRQESDRVFQEALHRVLDRAGFPTVEKNGRTRRYIVFHSLRHTFGSHWMLDGGDIYKLQRIMGHKSLQMTERYAHLAPQAFSGDFGRMGTTIPMVGQVCQLPSVSSISLQESVPNR